jgi:hypothetical protein
MASLPKAAWWELRRAHSRKPATYRCPICGRQLHAMSEHALITPEGDISRRRHAHTACVAAARKAGRLRTRDDWRRLQPREPGLISRLWSRLRRAPNGAR